MTTVTSRRAPAPKQDLKERRKLAHELLGIHIDLAGNFARMETIEASLKTIATAAGDGFTEIFVDKGQVAVAPGHAAEFKGDVPVVQTEVWLKLSAAKKQQLVESGLIKVEPQWGKKSSGRVAVKVF